MGAALDGLLHGQVEGAALVAAPVGAAVGRQPAEGAAEVQIGDLEEADDGHARGTPYPEDARSRLGGVSCAVDRQPTLAGGPGAGKGRPRARAIAGAGEGS